MSTSLMTFLILTVYDSFYNKKITQTEEWHLGSLSI